MVWIILFVFGIAIGSFLNVVALRYDGEKFILNPKAIGGRSHCPHCKKTLRWFELIPLVSFVIQGGKCRRCGVTISWCYPLVELLSGLIFLTVPLYFFSSVSVIGNYNALIFLSAFWIIAFEVLLLIAYIDIRLGIIPDELNIGLLILALIMLAVMASEISIRNFSFFGVYANLFGLQGNLWIDHIVGAVFGVLFFAAIVGATRGKGMGMGDVKFALPLGLLFGWPDIFVIAIMAFVLGGIFGVFAISFGKKKMKSAIPFGPFLVLASVVAFFWGTVLFNWYFHLLGL